MSKKIRTREEIDEKYKWKLEDMFSSDEAWEEELASTLELAKEYATLKGTLGESGASLLKALKMLDEVSHHASRLYVYANMRMHQDTSVAKYQGYAAKADAMSVEEYRKAAIDAVKQLSTDVGIPADLKDIVKPEDIPFLAQSAFDDACRPGNPKATSVEDITKLYESLI